jgi:hypothetical protein
MDSGMTDLQKLTDLQDAATVSAVTLGLWDEFGKLEQEWLDKARQAEGLAEFHDAIGRVRGIEMCRRRVMAVAADRLRQVEMESQRTEDRMRRMVDGIVAATDGHFSEE